MIEPTPHGFLIELTSKDEGEMLPFFLEDTKDAYNDQGRLQLGIFWCTMSGWYVLRVLCKVHSYDLVMSVSKTINAASAQQNISGTQERTQIIINQTITESDHDRDPIHYAFPFMLTPCRSGLSVGSSALNS